MSQNSWSLIDAQSGQSVDQLILSSSQLGLNNCRVERRTLRGGLREGVELLEIDNGRLRFALLPQRGMGVWKAWHGATEIGWQSPVAGPVHPRFVPLTEPSGLGWLDGFDELLVRCGLYSNGAPEFDDRGQLKFPLHGLIANRPAHQLEVSVDPENGEISVVGSVDETRFHFQKLRLKSTITTRIGEPGFRIVDQVTNLSGNPGEMELLYHINFGPPLLSAGGRLVAPAKNVTPRTPHAARDAQTWDLYAEPQVAAEEQVYFLELLGDSQSQTRVLLKNFDSSLGVSLAFDLRQLPAFTLWKNAATLQDGYVTGLEPGVNFPNPRSIEKAAGRVIALAAGETRRFELALEFHADRAAVARSEQQIASILGSQQTVIHSAPGG